MSDDPNRAGDELEAQRVKAEALGEPGQRRFRLLAIVAGETQIVWMEKEQLRRLGQALEQVLENLPDRGPELAPPSLIDFNIDTTRQMRAGRMELGYDEARDQLIILAHDLEEDDDDASPAFACRITRAQARELSEEAEAVVTAGRPICPLCHRPMGPGPHVCAKQNGHFPHRIDEVRADEDDE